MDVITSIIELLKNPIKASDVTFGYTPPKEALEQEIALLGDFKSDSVRLEQLESALKTAIEKNKIDGKIHNINMLWNNWVNGLTFQVISVSIIKDVIIEFSALCNLRKYKYKAKRWIGILYKLTPEEQGGFTFQHFYSEGEWKYDAKAEELVEKLLK